MEQARSATTRPTAPRLPGHKTSAGGQRVRTYRLHVPEQGLSRNHAILVNNIVHHLLQTSSRATSPTRQRWMGKLPAYRNGYCKSPFSLTLERMVSSFIRMESRVLQDSFASGLRAHCRSVILQLALALSMSAPVHLPAACCTASVPVSGDCTALHSCVCLCFGGMDHMSAIRHVCQKTCLAKLIQPVD